MTTSFTLECQKGFIIRQFIIIGLEIGLFRFHFLFKDLIKLVLIRILKRLIRYVVILNITIPLFLPLELAIFRHRRNDFHLVRLFNCFLLSWLLSWIHFDNCLSLTFVNRTTRRSLRRVYCLKIFISNVNCTTIHRLLSGDVGLLF